MTKEFAISGYRVFSKGRIFFKNGDLINNYNCVIPVAFL